MKKAYIKALAVIRSCTSEAHVITTYNYIHNFRVLFGEEYGCDSLTKQLMERCTMKRKKVRGV